MSSSSVATYLGCALGAFVVATADAKPHDVCAPRPRDRVQQIYVFDGAPADLAYLAPDDEAAASNTYSLKAIHDRGGFVTVRCQYASGSVVDVRLEPRVERCVFRPGGGYGRLFCR